MQTSPPPPKGEEGLFFSFDKILILSSWDLDIFANIIQKH